MKAITPAVTLLCVTLMFLALPALACADLIDLGSVVDDATIFNTPQWRELNMMTFFDDAMHIASPNGYINQWYTSEPHYNPIYKLPGGTFFNTDLLSATGPVTQAQISWDFTGDDFYSLRMILVDSVSPDHTFDSEHFYLTADSISIFRGSGSILRNYTRRSL